MDSNEIPQPQPSPPLPTPLPSPKVPPHAKRRIPRRVMPKNRSETFHRHMRERADSNHSNHLQKSRDLGIPRGPRPRAQEGQAHLRVWVQGSRITSTHIPGQAHRRREEDKELHIDTPAPTTGREKAHPPARPPAHPPASPHARMHARMAPHYTR